MMVNGRTAKNMGKELISSLMVIHMWVNTSKESLMEMEYILGKMGAYMKESFRMDLNMAEELGESLKTFRTVIDILATINLIRNMDLESSTGLLGIFTRVAIIMMREKAMVRCTLLMAPSIKETGSEAYKMGRLLLYYQIKL
jgi:hypothetical protein